MGTIKSLKEIRAEYEEDLLGKTPRARRRYLKIQEERSEIVLKEVQETLKQPIENRYLYDQFITREDLINCQGDLAVIKQLRAEALDEIRAANDPDSGGLIPGIYIYNGSQA